jgi:hypothetical protein
MISSSETMKSAKNYKKKDLVSVYYFLGEQATHHHSSNDIGRQHGPDAHSHAPDNREYEAEETYECQGETEVREGVLVGVFRHVDSRMLSCTRRGQGMNSLLSAVW